MLFTPCDTNQAFVDNDLRLKLARAVMAPDERRGLPLEEHHGHKTTTRQRGEPQDWTPVADLVARGTAYMVLVDDHLLVLDADNDLQAATVRDVAEQLDADGQRYVIVRSGRPGHLQLWARVGRRKRTRIEQRIRDALQERPEARPDARESRWVRPPLSPHTAGSPVALDNVSPAEAVEILQARGPSTRPVRSGRGQRDVHALVDRLGPGARRTLEQGTERRRDDGQPDRSAGQFSVLMSCATAGFTFAEVETLFSSSYVATARYREEAAASARNAVVRLQADYERATTVVASRPVVDDRHSAQVALVNVAAHIRAETWKRKPGTEAVLWAHHRIAERAGRISGHHASRYELALAAGVTERTVGRAHAWLEAEGWLICTKAHTDTRAATWAFAPTRQSAPPVDSTGRWVCDRGGVTARVDWADDIWRYQGLGHTAGQVANLLCHCCPRTVEDLTAARRYARCQTVKDHLRRLEAVGLARETPHGWVRGDNTPAEAAKIACCAGISERYRKLYALKSQLFRQAREAYRNSTRECTTVDPVTGEVMPDLAFTVVDRRIPSPNDVDERNLMAA